MINEMAPNIDGFPAYHVTRGGRVFRIVAGLGKGSANGKIKELIGSVYTHGYVYVRLRSSGIKRAFRVHRLVATAYIPNPETKPHVNHIDGVKTNNNETNLEWVTTHQNMQHAHTNGLVNNANGERAGGSKLSDALAIEIQQLLKTNLTKIQIADLYGVNYKMIWSISSGRCWSHLKTNKT